MNGIFAMYYTGDSGFGHAIFLAKDGIVSGADVAGCILDGVYSETLDSQFSFQVKYIAPVGVTLVTGQSVVGEPLSQDISATLPADFANGNYVQIQMPLGPVNVIFKKLREI